MDNTTERNTGNWVYSGEKLKNFLHRKGISYKDAAKELGIDKNTVGKAVRGGNLNVDIILRICNIYNRANDSLQKKWPNVKFKC